MRTPLLMVMGYLFYFVHAQTADFTPSKDFLTEILNDGCARPIANEYALPMAPFPEKCRGALLGGDGAHTIHIPKRVRDWGSNGLGGEPWRFVDEECNEFFVALHERIETHMPGILITPHDLFHGHVLSYGPTGKDHVAVVLHAKEYPSNLEIIKNKYQVETESFASTDIEFRYRNFLYLSHRDGSGDMSALRNEVYLIEERGQCADYFSQLSTNSLSEGVMEMVLENGKLLGDVNLFLPRNISRIKYHFYATFDFHSLELIEDYEAIDTGKSVAKRLFANQMMDILLFDLGNRPLIYFLTGR